MQERKHRAEALEQRWGRGQDCGGLTVPAPALGWRRDPGAGAGSAIPGTSQLRCYFVWVRWERVNAPAVPDRRLRAEPNQERSSPGPKERGPCDANPGRYGRPGRLCQHACFLQPYQRLFPCSL